MGLLQEFKSSRRCLFPLSVAVVAYGLAAGDIAGASEADFLVQVLDTKVDEIPSPKAQIILRGLPTDAEVTLNGQGYGSRREFKWPDFPKNRTFSYTVLIKNPNGDPLRKTVTLRAGQRVALIRRTEIQRSIVITELLCIRQEGINFPDRPRLVWSSDLRQRQAVQTEEMRTGQSWSPRISLPASDSATFDLFDIDTFDSDDFLGQIRINVDDDDRSGDFRNDPNRVGCVYRLKWRIEPDDTFTESLVRAFGNDQNAARLRSDLQDRVTMARQTVTSSDQRLTKSRRVSTNAKQSLQSAESALDAAERMRAAVESQESQLSRERDALAEEKRTQSIIVNSRKREFQQKESAATREVATARAMAKTEKMALSAKVSNSEQKVKSSKNLLDDAEDALVKVKTDIGDIVEALLPPELKRALSNARDARDDAKMALKRAEEEFNKAKDSLADRETYFEWRRKTFSEAEKLGDSFEEQIREFGTVAEKAMLPALKLWKAAEREARRIRDNIASNLNALNEKRKDLLSAKNIEREANELRKKRDRLVTTARHTVKRAEKELENAGEAVEKAVQLLAGEEVIVFRIDNKLRFNLNMYTGAYSAKVDLNFAGLEWDAAATRALMAGEFKIPSVNPVRVIASALGQEYEESNDYADTRSRKHTANADASVYFASEPFVEWGGPETATRLIAASIFDGGNQAVQEARQQFGMELDSLFTWMTLNGEREIDGLLVDAISKAVGLGGQVSVPDVTIEPASVKYRYDADMLGLVPLPDKVVELIKSKFSGLIKDVSEPSLQLDHIAYSARWKSENTTRLTDRLKQFESKLMTGGDESSTAFNRVLPKLVERLSASDELGEIVEGLTSASFASQHADAEIRRRIVEVLAIKQSDLEAWYVPGDPIIRLENTPVAERFETFLGKLSIGNKGSSRVKRLEFNLETYTFSGELELKHEHSWGSLRDLLNAI